jgi:G3E family GTPase
MDSIIQRARIPVYLLTGYLGSGKTTLLAAWLQEVELADSALIVNEIGEVGLDQHLLNAATEDVTLVDKTCVCCTGLPGLGEALADLFWARLERKTKAFQTVIIETTGLADPKPIVQLLKRDSLLNERYRLAGVIATFSAVTGSRTVVTHPEAMSQLTTADLVVITKIDLLPQSDLAGLAASVSAVNPNAKLAMSGKASLSANEMLSMLPTRLVADLEPTNSVLELVEHSDPRHSHRHGDGSFNHAVQTVFLPLPHSLKRHTLALQLRLWICKHGNHLLRLKGMVRIDDGSVLILQWAYGDVEADIAPFGRVSESFPAMRMGLTVIASEDFDFSAAETLSLLLESR